MWSFLWNFFALMGVGTCCLLAIIVLGVIIQGIENFRASRTNKIGCVDHPPVIQPNKVAQMTAEKESPKIIYPVNRIAKYYENN